MKPVSRRTWLRQAAAIGLLGLPRRARALLAAVFRTEAAGGGMLAFAEAEVRAAAQEAKIAAPGLRFRINAALGEQVYRVERTAGAFVVTAGDTAGAMYGGLDVAEALRLGAPALARTLKPQLRQPRVRRRGIKFNIPLDLRTPSYGDAGTSGRENIPEVWSREFWAVFLDELARHRYNMLSLWSLHPFPSLVKVPEFPDVALDDVWRSREPFGEIPFDHRGRHATPPRFLANHEVVKRITIDEKIAFWREVMRMAADRGIEVYLITWNAFTYGATGKYGIDDSLANPAATAYLRASVRELVTTYPLLKGIGITAGENMTADDAAKEQWLWATYGEGVRDALRGDPRRDFRLIHRFWQTTGEEIPRHWRNYPGWPSRFTFSFKYSWAHMYSEVNPGFIRTVLPMLDALGMKTWLTVRNDDLYALRWGDPEYARAYIRNMPPSDKLAGFYMGPDGFTWGRDFLDRATAGQDLGTARRLYIQKHWYSFMLWGRLSFDPSLPDELFIETFRVRYPGADAADLFTVTALASQIVPLVTRFFWHETDLEWLPEACARFVGDRGTHLYSVAEFMKGVAMPGSGILTIREWRLRHSQGQSMNATTPPEVAEQLAYWAQSTLDLVEQLRADPANTGTAELRQTIDDNEAMAHLGSYYAEKIRTACDLALFDASASESHRASALGHLENALSAWKRYAAVRDAQYLPNFYSRIGWIDITALTAAVAHDTEIARAWRPGSLA